MPRSLASAVALVICVGVCSAVALAQTGVPAQFDATRAITINGAFGGLVMPSGPNTFLIIQVTDAGGKTEKWILQGNPLARLIRDGWKPKAVAPLGSPVSATAYRGKAGANLTLVLPHGSPEEDLALAKAGRLVHGIDVTFADGKPLPFGPGK
jgi:hypothetical protein